MKLKPFGDRVILQRQAEKEKTNTGIILPDSAKEKPKVAVVIAVGPGQRQDGEIIPMQVKVGDRVICKEYTGTDVKIGDEEYLIVGQEDIIAIVV